MKINIEIDCTPEEARSFLGLPDLKPMQTALMAKIEEQMMDAVSNLTPAAMRAWLPWVQSSDISRGRVEETAGAMEKSAAGNRRHASRRSADEGE